MGHGTIGDVMGESMLSVVFSSWPVDGGESVRIGSILQFESDVVMSKPKATVKDKAEEKEMSGRDVGGMVGRRKRVTREHRRRGGAGGRVRVAVWSWEACGNTGGEGRGLTLSAWFRNPTRFFPFKHDQPSPTSGVPRHTVDGASSRGRAGRCVGGARGERRVWERRVWERR